MTDIPPTADPYSRGLALQQAGKITEAAACFREALSQRPDDHRALYRLGTIAHHSGDARAAESLLRSAIGFGQQQPDYCVALGQLLAQTGRPRQALDAYRAALSTDSSHFNALLQLGLLQERMGETAAALQNFERALGIDGDNLTLLVRLGRLLNLTGNSDRATTLSRRAIALKPDLAPAHANLATGLAAAGRHDAAIDAFKRSLTLQPQQPDIYCRLGNSLLATGQDGRARHAYEHCLRRAPDHSVSLAALAAVLEKSGQRALAAALMDYAGLTDIGQLTPPASDRADEFRRELRQRAITAAESGRPGLLPAHGTAITHLVASIRRRVGAYMAARPADWRPLPGLGSLWPAPEAWRLRLNAGIVSAKTGAAQRPLEPGSWLRGLVFPGKADEELMVALGAGARPGVNQSPGHELQLRPGEFVLFPSFFHHRIAANSRCVAIDLEVIPRRDPP